VIAVVLALFAIGLASGDTQDTAENPSPAIETPAIETTASTQTEAPFTMPDLVGLSTPDALQALEPFGIATISQSERLSRRPEGTVLSQVPPAGSEVFEPFVTVVVAEPFPRVPNVMGDKVTKARTKIKDAGFSVTVKQQASSKPKGTVIRQSPEGGTSAHPGRVVTLIVAKPAPSGGGGGGNCNGSYPGVCIPPYPPDLDCGDVPFTNFQVTGIDPHGFDGDSDGVGCET
jgi:hypothetical protein